MPCSSVKCGPSSRGAIWTLKVTSVHGSGEGVGYGAAVQNQPRGDRTHGFVTEEQEATCVDLLRGGACDQERVSISMSLNLEISLPKIDKRALKLVVHCGRFDSTFHINPVKHIRV